MSDTDSACRRQQHHTWLRLSTMLVTRPMVQLQYGSLPQSLRLQHEIPFQQQWSGRTSSAPVEAPVEVTQLPDWRGMATMYCSRDDTSMLDRPGMEGHP